MPVAPDEVSLDTEKTAVAAEALAVRAQEHLALTGKVVEAL